jgi:hypothetical protein
MQVRDSSMQVLLMNVPVLDKVGIESKIIWHLAEREKSFLK